MGSDKKRINHKNNFCLVPLEKNDDENIPGGFVI